MQHTLQHWIRTVAPLICLAMVHPFAVAQFTQQVLLSGPDMGDAYTQGVAAVPDGSRYVQLHTDSGQVFTRLDPSGATEWSRRLSTAQAYMTNHFPMATMPDGGLAVILAKVPPWIGQEQHFEVVRLAPDGTTTWSIQLIVPDSSSSVGSFDWALGANSSGELFCSGSGTGGSVVVKLSETGILQWCRRLWDPDLTAALDGLEAVEPTSDGGCVFLGTKNVGVFEALVTVGRLDMAGDPLWIQSYAYNAPNVNLLWPRLAITDGDLVLVSAYLTTGGGTMNTLLHSIDPSGNLVRTDLYSSTSIFNNPVVSGIEALGASEVVMTGYAGGPHRAVIVNVDTSGVILSAHMVNADTVGQVEHNLQLWSADAAGGYLHLAGDLSETDVVFGTVVRSASAWRTTNGLTDACFVEPMDLQRITVPVGVVTTTAVGNVQSLAASQQAGGTLNEALTLPSTSSFCTAVPVNELPGRPEWSLSPNPASHEIMLMGKGLSAGTTWTIIDATGATVKSGRLSGANDRIAVQALVPGAYVLRTMNDRGTQAARFIKY